MREETKPFWLVRFFELPVSVPSEDNDNELCRAFGCQVVQGECARCNRTVRDR